MEKNIFRKDSREWLTGDNEFGVPLKIISPAHWTGFFCLIALLALTVIWAFFGSIPIFVYGSGKTFDSAGIKIEARFAWNPDFEPLPGMKVKIGFHAIDQQKWGKLIGKIIEIKRKSLDSVTVIIQPEGDGSTPSGYLWTIASGPPFKILPNSSCSVEILSRTKKPISYLIPEYGN